MFLNVLRSVLATVSYETTSDINSMVIGIDFTSSNVTDLFYDNSSSMETDFLPKTVSFENSGSTNVLIISPVYVNTCSTIEHQSKSCQPNTEEFINEDSIAEFICRLHKFGEENQKLCFRDIISIGNSLHKSYTCSYADEATASLVPICVKNGDSCVVESTQNKKQFSPLDFVIVGVFVILFVFLSYFLFGISDLPSY